MKKVIRDFTGILLGIIVGIAIYHFYINLKTSPNKSLLNIGTNNPQTVDINSVNPSSTVVINANEKKNLSSEFYLCEISDFYESLITVLYSTIGILLVVSFIYVYTRSKSHAEEIAREALQEEAFQITLKDKIQKSFNELKNEGEIADLIESMSGLSDRIDFLEKAVTEKSYEIGPADETQKVQGEIGDGNNKKV